VAREAALDETAQPPAPAVAAGRAGRLGLHAVVVGAPVVFVPTAAEAFVGPKTVVVVAGGALLGASALLSWSRRLAPRLPAAVEVPLVALAGWSVVSTLASPRPGTALVGHPASGNGLITILAYAGAAAGAATLTSGRDPGALLRTLWFGAGGPVLAYGGLQLHDRLTPGVGRWDPVRWPPSSFDHTIWSTLGNPDGLAALLAMLLPVGLVLLAATDSKPARLASVVMLGALVGELAVTGGRAGWLGAAVALAVLAATTRGSWPATRGLAAALAAAVVLAVTLAVGVVATGQGKYRLRGLAASGPGTTVDLRIQLWRTAGRVVADRPLTGLGPDGLAGSFLQYRSDAFGSRFGVLSVATDPHDAVLAWAVATGVPGALGFVGLVVGAAWTVAGGQRASGRPAPLLRAAVVAAVAAWLVQSLFSRHDVAVDLVGWVLLGVAVGTTRDPGAEGDQPTASADRGAGWPGPAR
jgi:hypothetical protein